MMFVTTGRPVDFVIDRRRDHDSGVTVLRDCAPCYLCGNQCPSPVVERPVRYRLGTLAISSVDGCFHRQTEPPATDSPCSLGNQEGRVDAPPSHWTGDFGPAGRSLVDPQ